MDDEYDYDYENEEETPAAVQPVVEDTRDDLVQCFVSKKRVPPEDTVELKLRGEKVRVIRRYIYN